MDEMRDMMDSLMGKDRNQLAKGVQPNDFHRSDVCKFFLLEYCPNDLFRNTKSDLGECPLIHSDNMRDAFEADPNYEFYKAQYEADMYKFLVKILESVENRIVRSKRRIQAASTYPVEKNNTRPNELELVNERVAELMKKADEAGAKGNVDLAEQITNEANQIRAEAGVVRGSAVDMLVMREAQLRVCPICGAMQSVGDASTRFESHISGKQHLGFERVRGTLNRLRNTEKERRVVLLRGKNRRSKEEPHRSQEIDHSTSKARKDEVNVEEEGCVIEEVKRPITHAEKYRERHRDRHYDRSRDRDHDSYRNGDRDRNRDRYREKSRDHDHYRSRDRDRDRDRERDRNRGRDKDRDTERDRDRERNKDREKDRENNKDRDKDKDKEKNREKDRDRDRDRDKGRDKDRDRERDRDQETAKAKIEERNKSSANSQSPTINNQNITLDTVQSSSPGGNAKLTDSLEKPIRSSNARIARNSLEATTINRR